MPWSSVTRTRQNGQMDVFISSVIADFEPFRTAAAAAVESLGHRVLRAEDLGASATSPQSACLNLVRTADAVVLLLGERYGTPQSSGLSATHEEYREATHETPVLAFVQDGATFEQAQESFVSEVRAWEGGHYTSSFQTPEDLRSVVTQRLHEHILTTEAQPLNESELAARAEMLLPAAESTIGQRPLLMVALAAGPTRYVLRPAELASGDLHDTLLAHAVIGPLAVLSLEAGVATSVTDHEIFFGGGSSGSGVTITDQGSIVIAQPASEPASNNVSFSAVIEEAVVERLERSFRLAGTILDTIDPVKRLTHVAPLISMTGSGFTPWRTAAEQAASPNSYTLGPNVDGAPVRHHLTPPVRRRAELIQRSSELAADAMVLLRHAHRS